MKSRDEHGPDGTCYHCHAPGTMHGLACTAYNAYGATLRYTAWVCLDCLITCHGLACEMNMADAGATLPRSSRLRAILAADARRNPPIAQPARARPARPW